MRFPSARAVFRDSLTVYWTLVKIMLPVMVLTRLAVEFGVIETLSPLLAPAMTVLGLPPELGFAWLTGILVGIWAGAVAMFTVMPVERLSAADVTILSALLLLTHSLPIEQRIVQKAGPGFWATTLIRLAGGYLFAILLAAFYSATGWLEGPAAPHWVPVRADPGWGTFLVDTAKTLAVMYAVLLALLVVMRIVEQTSLQKWLTAALAPVLRLAGLGPQTVPFTIVGILLGLSFGGALIIAEARRGGIAPRDLFLACVFMGFGHSLIEDTLVVVALGADLTSVFLARLLFSIAAVAVLARLLRLVPDRIFARYLFSPQTGTTG